MSGFEEFTFLFSNWMWGLPLVILLTGGGLFFLFYSEFLPFRHFNHAFKILSGRYNDKMDPGEITHYQAVSTALASTIGMGNISGIAVAIATGGPGAIFWMWVSALTGSATKFFTCTLSVMYRSRDSQGNLQGGPMYYITQGLGKRWKPLAILFSLAGMIGVLPLFQVNQLTQAVREIVLRNNDPSGGFYINITTGIILAAISAFIIFGGIRRIGLVAAKTVPFMILLYFMMTLFVLIRYSSSIVPSLMLIFRDAFSGQAMLGGALGQLIILGIKRGTFSNESGLGTAPMAHGAARTREPVREGLVAMLEPIADTIVVCSMTALVVIVTGVWRNPESSGITLTSLAFESAIPGYGSYLLLLCVFLFAATTMFSYPYYGAKCFGYLFGASNKKYYLILYLGSILFASVASVFSVINLIDGVYAIMAIPNMLAAILLAPRVKVEAKKYFLKLKNRNL